MAETTPEEQMKELASQLRQPQGEKGVAVADLMNETNSNMTRHSISKLNVSDRDTILELGHGNCSHLTYLLQNKSNVFYYGLEMSELMHMEAQRINKEFIEKKQASFHLYAGVDIPFADNYFDKIFTVNTIYFWSDPKALLLELYRVVKSNGRLNITFSPESFMKQLPFTQFGFELYDNNKITRLIKSTPFTIVELDAQKETVKTNTGDLVERPFATIMLEK